MQSIQRKKNDMTEQLQALINQQEFEAAKIQLQKLQFLQKLTLECETLEQDLADAL
jgi:hypothetical protein